MALPKIYDISPTLGCDPEFFFKQDGEIIGAEKVLPKTGLKAGDSKFIIDGVQAELNPRPSTCREILGTELRSCFMALLVEMKKTKGLSADFSRTVEISKENLAQLDEAAKKFGCAPSMSIYKKIAGINISKVDPLKYRKRAAGGHIHIGHAGKSPITASDLKVPYTRLYKALAEDHERTVEMLDIICGNTCVLIDRDKGNIERRKLYGKAGEYRLPVHGLEYRTLSNFWLTSYQTLSLAFGLVRTAVNMMSDVNADLFYKELTSCVNQSDIHKAINNNDADLAMKNFMAIEKVLLEIVPATGRWPINSVNIKAFHHFVDKVQSDGLEYWFKQDVMSHWTKTENYQGFNDYLNITVGADMKNSVTKKSA